VALQLSTAVEMVLNPLLPEAQVYCIVQGEPNEGKITKTIETLLSSGQGRISRVIPRPKWASALNDVCTKLNASRKLPVFLHVKYLEGLCCFRFAFAEVQRLA
jgi:hypothetical protein